MPQMTDTIEAKRRDARGKGAAHKLRKTAFIPAVVYGPGAEPSLLALDPYKFSLQRRQFGASHIYKVKVDDGAPFAALVREMQIDPLSQDLLHVDLYALDMTKPLHVSVGVDLEGKPVGLLEGGVLQQVLRRIMVACLPNQIPEKLSLDVSGLAVGQSIKISDIKLPEGVKVVGRLDQAVATVSAPQEEAATPATPDAAAAAAPAGEAAAAAAPAAKVEAKEVKAKK